MISWSTKGEYFDNNQYPRYSLLHQTGQVKHASSCGVKRVLLGLGCKGIDAADKRFSTSELD